MRDGVRDESQETTFLFSSFRPCPDEFFQGYCFVGRDYIYGAIGAREYFEATGRHVGPGHDGCYVQIVRKGSRHVLVTDYSGLKKVYYFSRDGIWAVSNSLADLVEHLRANNVGLGIDFAQLGTVRVRSTVTTQLSCYQTPIADVRLLPTRGALDIGATGIALKRLRAYHVQEGEDYATRLKRFLSLWVSRVATLLSDPDVAVTCDLTGGVDSRVVFAMLERASALLGASAAARVAINSNRSALWDADLQAARAIARDFGREVNADAPSLGIALTEAQRYATWRSLCLGSYHSPYFPIVGPIGREVHLGGGGGENHRPFYRLVDPEAFATPQARRFEPAYLGRAWKAEFLRITAELAQETPGVHPLVLHYREFRHRLHSGREPQYSVNFLPLGSRALDEVSADGTRIISGQIAFDAMESLIPGISAFPYDDPSKAPSHENLANLTTVALPDDELGVGRVFAAPSPEDIERTQARVPLDALAEEFESATTPAVEEFLGSEMMRTAREVLDAARSAGGFRHASEGKDVVRVLTAGLVFGAVEEAAGRRSMG